MLVQTVRFLTCDEMSVNYLPTHQFLNNVNYQHIPTMQFFNFNFFSYLLDTHHPVCPRSSTLFKFLLSINVKYLVVKKPTWLNVSLIFNWHSCFFLLWWQFIIAGLSLRWCNALIDYGDSRKLIANNSSKKLPVKAIKMSSQKDSRFYYIFLIVTKILPVSQVNHWLYLSDSLFEFCIAILKSKAVEKKTTFSISSAKTEQTCFT